MRGWNRMLLFLGAAGVNWENVTIPHDVMVLFVVRNVKDRADVWKAVTNKDAAKFPNTRWLGINRVPVYEGVTFDGAPDVGGKYPYVYVMGAEGTEPLVKGPFDAGTANRVQLAIAAEKKRLETSGLRWRRKSPRRSRRSDQCGVGDFILLKRTLSVDAARRCIHDVSAGPIG